MIDELLLLSGNDIPFPMARLTIHQPKIKEIAYITESRFWPGCQFLKFDKDLLPEQDKVNLLNRSNFNILLSMIQEKTLESQNARINVLSVLALIFPQYKISLTKQIIQIQHIQTEEIFKIDENNFENFKEILINIFVLKDGENKQYNPQGDLAKKIANKIKKGREQKAKLAPQTKIAILSRYVSILAVAQQKDINTLMNYTVYQLMDEFNRYILKQRYDTWEKYRIAGATNMQDPEDWLKDIHQK